MAAPLEIGSSGSFYRMLKRERMLVVFFDNVSSHLDPHVISMCQEHQIKFVFLPVNSFHLTQPLEVAFFRPVKSIWRKLIRQWKMTTNGQRCATLLKREFPHLLKRLYDYTLVKTENNLKSRFRKCGILPTDVQVLLIVCQ